MTTYSRKQNKLTSGVTLNAQFKGLVNVYDDNYRMRFFVYDEATQQGESIATNQVFTLNQIITQFFQGRSADEMVMTRWEVTLGSNPKLPNLLTIISFAPFTGGAFFKDGFVTMQESWQGCKNSEKPTDTKAAYLSEYYQHQRNQAIKAARQELADALKGLFKGDFETTFGVKNAVALKAKISATFKPGMSWDSRSSFHVDHVRPLIDWDILGGETGFNHFANLQALYPAENFAKHAN